MALASVPTVVGKRPMGLCYESDGHLCRRLPWSNPDATALDGAAALVRGAAQGDDA